jgi:hypothetical protein
VVVTLVVQINPTDGVDGWREDEMWSELHVCPGEPGPPINMSSNCGVSTGGGRGVSTQ